MKQEQTQTEQIPDNNNPTHKAHIPYIVAIFIILIIVIFLGFQNYQLNLKISTESASKTDNLPHATPSPIMENSVPQPTPPQPTPPQPTSSNTHAIIGDCSEEECLFQGNEAVEGLGKVTGYYYSYNKIDWGDVPVTCDALIVEYGSNALVDDLINTVKKGNTINSITDTGKLILNINSQQNELNNIMRSTKENPVTLTVVRNSPQGRAAGACQSFVSILKIE